ncbi:MAG TPA: hypothetical protein DF715_09760 [Oceanicaulis sp.]|uniref:Uncharacterized protein n=1 Tax=Glycocaulis albus TaxID=1382801 RepID=A0ABQ1XIS7_9PROT|nr:hypothetical protein GCM10007420_07810 [Glycocaulis albus]HCY55789.1 hypothetical protein [Oceanicaulis sp.]|tara:strand:- start:165 stop:353 length:189 start_codon:yes stop_codon:yes gene_type:complete
MALSHGAAMADGPQFNFLSQRNQGAAQAAVRVPTERLGFGPQNPPELRARLAGKRGGPEGRI